MMRALFFQGNPSFYLGGRNGTTTCINEATSAPMSAFVMFL